MSEVKLSKQEQVKIQQLIADLKSENESKITAAISALSSNGHYSVIDPLIDLWCSGLSETNELAMVNLFHGLKDTSTIDPLINAFRSPETKVIHRKLVVAFWNSKLDFSPYLADFVLFAVEGDFLDVLEALTLIENLEFIPSESAILESQLLLSEYFNQEREKDEQKDALLTEIVMVIERFSKNEGTEDLYLE